MRSPICLEKIILAAERRGQRDKEIMQDFADHFINFTFTLSKVGNDFGVE